MKWDGQPSAIVGSAVATIATVVATAIALGAMMQSGHAEINSDIREIRTRINDVEAGLRAEIGDVDSRLNTLAVKARDIPAGEQEVFLQIIEEVDGQFPARGQLQSERSGGF